tara:strand:- start:1559 stop:1714 length:156 start_codon:yes stop_codon:yes gene_type:complete
VAEFEAITARNRLSIAYSGFKNSVVWKNARGQKYAMLKIPWLAKNRVGIKG